MNALIYHMKRFSSVREIPDVPLRDEGGSGRKVLDGTRSCGLPIMEHMVAPRRRGERLKRLNFWA